MRLLLERCSCSPSASHALYRLTMAALAAALATAVSAYNNGMGERPPMGWQTWCSVGECGEDHCFDGQIRAMADTLVLSGMKDLGYDWVVLDDCWHPTRDNATAELVPYPRFFPDGMKPVIDYVHSLGLKFGLYTSVGDRTCHGGWSPGSFGHYEREYSALIPLLQRQVLCVDTTASTPSTLR